MCKKRRKESLHFLTFVHAPGSSVKGANLSGCQLQTSERQIHPTLTMERCERGFVGSDAIRPSNKNFSLRPILFSYRLRDRMKTGFNKMFVILHLVLCSLRHHIKDIYNLYIYTVYIVCSVVYI